MHRQWVSISSASGDGRGDLGEQQQILVGEDVLVAAPVPDSLEPHPQQGQHPAADEQTSPGSRSQPRRALRSLVRKLSSRAAQ